ncbi:MAG: TlpA disulfide reductase family protein [Pseudomonadota bacterium]
MVGENSKHRQDGAPRPNEKRDPSAARPTPIWRSIAAAVVGLTVVVGLVVYLTQPPGQSTGVNSPATTTDGPAAGGSAQTADQSTKPQKLNTGEMRAFVYKQTPAAIDDFAFVDNTGAPVKLSNFAGRTVLLNLWATWCAPCRHEMPALDRLQQRLGGDDFEVVALSLDRGGLLPSQEFFDEIEVKALKLYADPTTRANKPLKVIGMPTTILIDAKGREVGRLVGPAEWDHPDAVRLIEAKLQRASES